MKGNSMKSGKRVTLTWAACKKTRTLKPGRRYSPFSTVRRWPSFFRSNSLSRSTSTRESWATPDSRSPWIRRQKCWRIHIRTLDPSQKGSERFAVGRVGERFESGMIHGVELRRLEGLGSGCPETRPWMSGRAYKRSCWCTNPGWDRQKVVNSVFTNILELIEHLLIKLKFSQVK